jgi:hypothetical protein
MENPPVWPGIVPYDQGYAGKGTDHQPKIGNPSQKSTPTSHLAEYAFCGSHLDKKGRDGGQAKEYVVKDIGYIEQIGPGKGCQVDAVKYEHEETDDQNNVTRGLDFEMNERLSMF